MSWEDLDRLIANAWTARKAVKGEFIRYMAENNVTTIDDFSGFEYEGFKWDGTCFIKESN